MITLISQIARRLQITQIESVLPIGKANWEYSEGVLAKPFILSSAL